MQQPNFTQCGIEFVAGLNDRYAKYNYTGPTRGIFNWINETERPPLITVEGCRALCGTDPDYYEWADASATISTWVLPVIGLILQAPFESNAFFRTVFALARWIGSPIASLSYILWNIKVAGKCALMVDMCTTSHRLYKNYTNLLIATRYEEVPDEDSQFEQIRDSFYLLSVLNQYTIKRKMPSVEAEKLLRISIFSDSLQLQVSEDESRSLVKRRRKLAKTIREARKKGVVPVFISLMWFLFSLVVSIQAGKLFYILYSISKRPHTRMTKDETVVLYISELNFE